MNIREPIIDGPESTPNSMITPMRIHEMAIMNWCNSHFFVRDGYPVPVIFSKPMDAFSHFQDLWKSSENPFRYLLDVKDEKGTPLYEPYPSPPRYPLISVNRRRESFRPSGNFSTHRQRTVSWPTVSDGTDRQDLGSVRVRNRPMGINFHLDVSFWCLRPDTQALFMQRVWGCFWRSGGAPQTWIPVSFPTEEGTIQVRMVMEGDLTDATPDDPGVEQVKYQTSFGLRIEGWQVDMRDLVLPTLWKVMTNVNYEVSPGVLATVYSKTEDLRDSCSNPNILTRESSPEVPEPRESALYWNVAQTASCPEGQTGDDVTVPARTVSSEISQEDADKRALAMAEEQLVCV